MEAELRQELARLQEREAELTRLLQLERERRVRAEQDSEIEKQACLELGQLLSREKQLRQTCPTSPSQMTLVPSCLKEEEEEEVEEEVEGEAKLCPAPHTNTDSKVCPCNVFSSPVFSFSFQKQLFYQHSNWNPLATRIPFSSLLLFPGSTLC